MLFLSTVRCNRQASPYRFKSDLIKPIYSKRAFKTMNTLSQLEIIQERIHAGFLDLTCILELDAGRNNILKSFIEYIKAEYEDLLQDREEEYEDLLQDLEERLEYYREQEHREQEEWKQLYGKQYEEEEKAREEEEEIKLTKQSMRKLVRSYQKKREEEEEKKREEEEDNMSLEEPIDNVVFCDEQVEEPHPVIQGAQGLYYVSDDGFKYHHSFPREWAFLNETNRTPGDCDVCVEEGQLRGVFIKYCSTCQREFNGTRGRPTYISEEYHTPSQYQAWIDSDYLVGEKYKDIGDDKDYNNEEKDAVRATKYRSYGEMMDSIEWGPSDYDLGDEYYPY